MDRRRMMIGAASTMTAMTDAGAQDDGSRRFTSGGTSIAVEWFAGPAGRAPGLLLLHGADGLASGDRYRLAARLLAGAGFHVGLPHYLDRTGERRVTYATLRERYPVWAGTVRDATAWLAAQPEVDGSRLGLVGISLGAALALTTASAGGRIGALVDISGPCPEALEHAGRPLPPTLILHGEEDRVVPVDNARRLGRLLAAAGTPHEVQLYPGQGHALSGPAQLDAASRTASFLARYLKG